MCQTVLHGNSLFSARHNNSENHLLNSLISLGNDGNPLQTYTRTRARTLPPLCVQWLLGDRGGARNSSITKVYSENSTFYASIHPSIHPFVPPFPPVYRGRGGSRLNRVTQTSRCRAMLSRFSRGMKKKLPLWESDAVCARLCPCWFCFVCFFLSLSLYH